MRYPEYLLSLVIAFTTNAAQSQSQFPEYKIKNKDFLRAIEIYTDSLDNFYHGTGVIFVEFIELKAYDSVPREVKSDGIRFDLKSSIERTNLLFRFYSDGEGLFYSKFPTGYFYHRKRPYLIYTDLDHLAEPPSKLAIRKINKILKPFEVRGQNRIAPFWVVRVKDEKIYTVYRFGPATPKH
jgi:hypothetical protein